MTEAVMTEAVTPALEAARSYHAAGLCLIPIRADGSKAPDVAGWKSYQSQRPSKGQLRAWFGNGTARGIGIVWGGVSGNGEALDFDGAGLLYDPFVGLCRQQGLGDLLDAMPLVETPSGGRHLLYRCREPVSGSQKLAERLLEAPPGTKGARQIGGHWYTVETLIETRGEGGYTLAPGSPAACHSEGRPYRFLRGGPDSLPTITGPVRRLLLALAATLNQHVEPARVVDGPRPRRGEAASGLRPGDDYNQRGNWGALLEPHGWHGMGQAGDKGLWQRPGKTEPGLSATSNYGGSNLLYVFSANAAPFEPLRAYSLFGAYALLEHGGDFATAALQLAGEGYGQPLDYGRALEYGGAAPLPAQDGMPAAPTHGAPARKSIAQRVIRACDVPPPPDELPLLFGEYLLKASAHWLTGQTGIGKSTFAYSLACALAEGRTLWGIETTPCEVLYADLETGDIARSFKVRRLYPDHAAPENLLFLPGPIRLPEEAAALTEFVQAEGIGLVIFDTARRCFSVKDENDNAEVYRQIVPTLDRLKALGVASLTMGHPPKNGGLGARGAGAQEDAGDVNLSLTMHRGEINDKDCVIALRVTKNRLLGHVPPLYLRRMGQDHFEPVAADEAVPMSAKPEGIPTARVRCAADVLDHLEGSASPIRFTDILREMVSRGHSDSTGKHAITELQKGGRIEHTGDGYVLAAEDEG